MTTCSAGSLLTGEQLAGSAPEAVAWVALEQPGPWGAKAFTGSHLDPDLGRAIEQMAAARGVRPALIRRPGRHADEASPGDGPRAVLVAHTRPGATWLLEGIVTAPDELLALDWGALRDGHPDAVRRSLPQLSPTDRARLLVCTNGTRDVCCAVLGRPVAAAAAYVHPGRVWEVTHTSGHRFAPTAALLPAGTLHGRLDAGTAVALVDAADRGETVLTGHRGRSTWPSPGQVAELEVRRLIGEAGLDAVSVADVAEVAAHTWSVEVGHADGRRWAVDVDSEPTEVERAESCSKGAVPLRRWRASVR